MDSHHQTGARKQNENVENLERSSERIKNMQSTLSHHDFFFQLWEEYSDRERIFLRKPR